MVLRFTLPIFIMALSATAQIDKSFSGPLAFARYCSHARYLHVFKPSDRPVLAARACLYDLGQSNGSPIVLRNLTVANFYKDSLSVHLKFAVPKDIRVHLSLYAWKTEELAHPTKSTGCSDSTPFETCYIEVSDNDEHPAQSPYMQYHSVSNQNLNCFLPPKKLAYLLDGCDPVSLPDQEHVAMSAMSSALVVVQLITVIACVAAFVLYKRRGCKKSNEAAEPESERMNDANPNRA